MSDGFVTGVEDTLASSMDFWDWAALTFAVLAIFVAVKALFTSAKRVQMQHAGRLLMSMQIKLELLEQAYLWGVILLLLLSVYAKLDGI
ncbi:MAG: hypothetical protein HXY22_09570 [Alphaproteobacteria bacterium]|nr:hypothetical protein [Alphaproteobacteria bacterium]